MRANADVLLTLTLRKTPALMLGNDGSTKKMCGEALRSTRYVHSKCASSVASFTLIVPVPQKKTRGPSLLKQHERVSAAKEAEKKRQGDEDEPPAFWDHGRDMAVGGKLLDDKSRNKFISEARGLGDRFGSGKSGGFL